jgi:hypothetical protein
MAESESYDAFLSFADPDRDLVETIHDLFWLMQKRTYFAPKDLQEAKTTKWRKQIRLAIQNSKAFVPIYTRHSIGRPWVLYESGLADARDLLRFPARVSSISVSEIEDLPSDSAFCYDLSNRENLASLITNVCSNGTTNRDEIAAKVQRKVMTSDLAKKVLTLSKKRWVFIAGNRPDDISQHDSGVDWFTTQSDYENRLRNFSEILTECLLDQEFSISACPQVPTLGKHITQKALNCLGSREYGEHIEFKISGIYPIDRDAREITLLETAKKKWLEHILSFRKTYLSNQEWLVIIGGTLGTQEEYEAACDCKVKVFAVPCFGGTARKIFEKEKLTRHHPCDKCDRKDGSCRKEDIALITSYLKGKIL